MKIGFYKFFLFYFCCRRGYNEKWWKFKSVCKKFFTRSYKYFLLKLLTQPKRKFYTSLKFSFLAQRKRHKKNGLRLVHFWVQKLLVNLYLDTWVITDLSCFFNKALILLGLLRFLRVWKVQNVIVKKAPFWYNFHC